MKRVALALTFIIIAISLLPLGANKAFAQGSNRLIVMVEDNKTEVQTGDIFRVYIKMEEAIDVFGLQLTLNYDPSMIQVVEDGINIEKNMKVFSSEAEDLVDCNKGVLTFPFINTESTKKKIESMPVAEIAFKALQNGPVIITATNIKAVNSEIRETHYNTQYQTALNIRDAPTTPPKDDKGEGQKDSGDKKPSENRGDTTEPNEKESTGNKGEQQNDSGNKKSSENQGGTTKSGEQKSDDSQSKSNNLKNNKSSEDEINGADSYTGSSDESNGASDQADNPSAVDSQNSKDKEVQKHEGTQSKTQTAVIVGIIILIIVLIGCVYLVIKKDAHKALLAKINRSVKNIKKDERL